MKQAGTLLRCWASLLAIPLRARMRRRGLMWLRFAVVAGVSLPVLLASAEALPHLATQEGCFQLSRTLRGFALSVARGAMWVAGPIAVLGGAPASALAHPLALARHEGFGRVGGRFAAALLVSVLVGASVAPLLAMTVWLGTDEPFDLLMAYFFFTLRAALATALTLLYDLRLARPYLALALGLGSAHALERAWPGLVGSTTAALVASSLLWIAVLLALALLATRRVPWPRAAPPPHEGRSQPPWRHLPLLWLEWRRLRPWPRLGLVPLSAAVAAATLALHLLPGAVASPLLHLTLTLTWLAGVLLAPFAWAIRRSMARPAGEQHDRILPLDAGSRLLAELLGALLPASLFLSGAAVQAAVQSLAGPLGPRPALALLGLIAATALLAAGVAATVVPIRFRLWLALPLAGLFVRLQPHLRGASQRWHDVLDVAGVDWFERQLAPAVPDLALARTAFGVAVLVLLLASPALVLYVLRGPGRA